ncbi:DUF4185 domain-containing protein [Candidatus Eisenbacteria bacterium]|uniref:DUF4185 domain-containing protein n=1 Tax=Eiseniibacteriota bacterium TaxID=2212470 RepID=A0ABV6YNU6_UNCEI
MTSQPIPVHPTGRAFTEAEVLFHRDPRWLGADAALSVPLGDGRTVWLFGDTFIAKSDAHVRSESAMVRNTVAIQTGEDPRTASITFHWEQHSDGSPASFFPERGQCWYWPGHGVRLDEGPLVIFLYSIVATPGRGLGFASAGYAIAVIDDPDASVETWNPRIVDVAPSSFDAVPATAVVQDGSYIVAVGIRQVGTHAGALVRYPSHLLAQGDVDGAEWWAGDERGWIPEPSLDEGGPAFVLDDAGAECSLHWDERSGSFIHIASYGFGASTIGLRTAPAVTGPWSSPVVVYRPPESDGPRPFVYAAKAHPELVGPDAADLVVTYATNSFEFGDLFTQEGARSLYWPRVVLVRVGK